MVRGDYTLTVGMQGALNKATGRDLKMPESIPSPFFPP